MNLHLSTDQRSFRPVIAWILRAYAFFRPALAAIAVLVGTLLALLVIDSWRRHAQHEVEAKMQAEMNAQHSRFDEEFAHASQALLDFQRRTAMAEQSRDEMRKLYDATRSDLTQTQQALRDAQAVIVQTQTALKRVQFAYDDLIRQSQPASATGSNDGGSDAQMEVPAANTQIGSELSARLSDLKQIDSEIVKVRNTWRNNRRAFAATWKDFVELLRAIDAAEREVMRQQAAANGSVYVDPPAFRQPTPPPMSGLDDMGQVRVGGGEILPDMPPAKKLEFLSQRLADRTDTLKKMQGALDEVMTAITSVNDKILDGQEKLRELQKKLTGGS
jgi:chromosome segregation ATPase